MKLKKAAMFGLDARIALVIFGALSVISGAALYFAIQSAQTEKYRQFLNEIVKASEQYYLDNGKPLTQENSYRVYASDLVNNRESLNTWKGPYIDGEVYVTYHLRNALTDIIDQTKLSIYLFESDTWADDLVLKLCAVDDSNCAEYIAYHANDDADASAQLRKIFENLDELIDGSDGTTAGRVRFRDNDVDDNDFIAFKSINRKRTF